MWKQWLIKNKYLRIIEQLKLEVGSDLKVTPVLAPKRPGYCLVLDVQVLYRTLPLPVNTSLPNSCTLLFPYLGGFEGAFTEAK